MDNGLNYANLAMGTCWVVHIQACTVCQTGLMCQVAQDLTALTLDMAGEG